MVCRKGEGVSYGCVHISTPLILDDVLKRVFDQARHALVELASVDWFCVGGQKPTHHIRLIPGVIGIQKPTGRIHHKNPIAFEDSQGGVDCPNLIPRFAVFDPDDVIDLRRAQAEYCYVFVS
jgi:hypothetical protein